LDENLTEPARNIVPVVLRYFESDSEDPAIATFEVPGTVFPRLGSVMSFVPPLEAAPIEGVIVAPEYEYVLHLYVVGETKSKSIWRLPTLDTPYSRRERKKGGRGSFTPAGGEMIEPPLLPHKPDIESLNVSPGGDIWVITPQRRTDPRLVRLDRLDMMGRRNLSVWIPGYLPSEVLSDGDLLCVLNYTPDGIQVFGMRLSY